MKLLGTNQEVCSMAVGMLLYACKYLGVPEFLSVFISRDAPGIFGGIIFPGAVPSQAWQST